MARTPKRRLKISNEGLPINRRIFLAGSAGVVALGIANPAVAAGRADHGPLVLHLSDNGRQIVIHEAPAGDPTAQCTPEQILRLHAGQFGPDAVFVLGRPFRADATHHVIYIDRASMGARTGLREALVLKREHKDAPWFVSFQSAAWGKTRTFGPAPFLTFVSNGLLHSTIDATAVNKALPRIAGGRLAGAGRGRYDAALDTSFRLTISSAGAAHVTAFGGRVSGVRRLTLQWDTGKVAAARPEAPCGFVDLPPASSALHRIAADAIALEEFRLGDTQKRAVRLGEVQASQLVVLHRPSDDEPSPSIARLAIPRATLEATAGEVRAGLSRINVCDVLIVEQLQDNQASSVRLVLSGHVAEPLPVECRTPAGHLYLSEQRADTGAVDRKGDETPNESFDRYRALLAPERAFDDAATVHIAGTLADRRDRPPIKLQRIAIRAELHAADTALDGAEWSRLRFGVKEAAAADTLGSPIDILHPMPDELRSDVTSVVALFPEEKATVARIALNRARLDAGVGGSLIDLRFGFRGLSLMLDAGGPRLVPDNTACGVVETPSGMLDDTRPIVILELPPQHLLEEAWFRPVHIGQADERLTRALATADKVIQARRPIFYPSAATPPTVEIARQREGEAESVDAFYALWREHFQNNTANCGPPLDYYSPVNRDHLNVDERRRIDRAVPAARRDFIKAVETPPVPPDSMRAHLSGGSRLAFRVHCAAVSDDLGRLEALPFTLTGLTNLGRHEPAVTRRAEVFIRPRSDGVVPPAAIAAIENIRGTDVLGFQGIVGGQRTVFAHMDAVRMALARAPEPHETALELVSRLVLSPSQRAVFLTDSDVPSEVYTNFAPDDPCACGEEDLHRLWSVRLVTSSTVGVQPSDLRVVSTPDFRPEALRPWPEGPRGGVHGAPPYGNAAPWMLPRAASEETGGKRSLPQRIYSLITGDAAEAQRAKMFRAGLSANDRHQLVLLSGAYGLPVMGKRRPAPAGGIGELVAEADQFEPYSYELGELDEGHAIYSPKTLDVEELSLSALGATFRHQTVFNPPLPALLRHERGAPKMFDGRPAFDGLSIQKWEHRSHGGRAEIDRVSYQGFLVPTGHRATFEKRTEREIIVTKDGGLRALLIQRMYIKVNEPTIAFGRLEQPYGGRCWLQGRVSVQEPSGGEIADPYDRSGGRIEEVEVGLAFWPTVVGTTEPMRFLIKVNGKSAEAPMIFVDKVAAADPANLRIVCERYNDADAGADPEGGRRHWRFGNAPLTYAPSINAGDTDLVTRSLVVRATGRNRESQPTNAWIGPNDEFAFTPALEGEGRPPIFPALERCEIALEGVGTLTGSEAQVVTAYFDGQYVREGFDPLNAEGRKNPLDLFLHFGSGGAPLDVGGNGDRSGGIARPNTILRGVSRRNGPVGYSNPVLHAAPGKPNQSSEPYDGRDGRLVSLVHEFAKGAAQPSKSAQQGATTTSVAAPSDEAIRNVATEFFNADAKLLGCITYRKLFEFLDTSGALDKILPALQQAVTFGLAVGDAIDEARDVLAETVLLPASRLLAVFETQWNELAAALKRQSSGDRLGDITLEQIFPDLNAAKVLLRVRLDEALGEANPLQIPERLSALHVAGERFLRALSDLADQPAETLAANVRSLLDEQMGRIRTLLYELGLPRPFVEALARIPERPEGRPEWLAGEAIRLVLAEGVPFPERLRPLQWPDIPAVLVEAEVLGRIYDRTFRSAAPDADMLVDAVRAVLDAASTADLPAVAKVIAALVAPLRKAAVDAKAQVASDPTLSDATKQRANVLLNTYLRQLDALDGAADDALKSAFVARLRAEWTRLREIKDHLGQLRDAADAHDVAALFKSLAALAERAGLDVAAAEIAALLKVLDETSAGIARPLADALSTLPDVTDATRAACLAWTSEGEPDRIVALTGLTPPLEPIRSLITEADKLRDGIIATPDGVRATFENRRETLAKVNAGLVQNISDGIDSTLSYLAGADGRTGLSGAGADLFCGAVDLFDTAAALKVTLDANRLSDPSAIHAAALAVRDVVWRGIIAPSQAMLSQTATFVSANGALLAGAGLLATLAELAANSGLAPDVQKAAEELRLRIESYQSETVAFARTGLEAINHALGVIEDAMRQPLMAAAARLQAATSSLSDTLWDRDSADLLKKIMDQLQALGPELFAPFSEASAGSPIDRLLDARRADGTTLRQLAASGNVFGSAQTAIAEIDNALQELLQYQKARLEGLPQALLEAFDAPAAALLDSGAGGLRDGYKKLIDARASLLDWLRRNAPWIDPAELDTTLTPPAGDADALVEEHKLIANLPASTKPLSKPEERKRVLDVLRTLVEDDPAPVVIARGVARLTKRIVRGDVLSIIDISALRDEIADRLSAMVPTRRTLSYRFGVTLTEGGTNELFSPKPGSRFEVGFRSEIDLLKPAAFTFDAEGAIGPFDVNLVALIGLNAMTLSFGGASFRTGRGVKASFACDFQDFEIKEALEFLKQLQESLAIGASGIFIEPLTWTSGLRVGYALDIGIIPLGSLSFANVSIALGADLPFTDEEAIFSVSLSRRLAPFGVYATPFAGSGFLTILSTANAIVGFEFGLEIGFGGAFQIGPLVAQGRVQAGFDVRTISVGGQRATEISGTFFAGGSASIWIFSFAAMLYVRLTHNKSTGAMRGEAVYAFSFKVGWVKFSYQVRVSYGQDALGGSSSRSTRTGSLAPRRRTGELTQFASAGTGTLSDALPETVAEDRTSTPLPKAKDAVRDTVRMEEDWRVYAGYFDEALLEGFR